MIFDQSIVEKKDILDNRIKMKKIYNENKELKKKLESLQEEVAFYQGFNNNVEGFFSESRIHKKTDDFDDFFAKKPERKSHFFDDNKNTNDDPKNSKILEKRVLILIIIINICIYAIYYIENK